MAKKKSQSDSIPWHSEVEKYLQYAFDREEHNVNLSETHGSFASVSDALSRPPSHVCLRINTLKTSVEEVESLFKQTSSGARDSESRLSGPTNINGDVFASQRIPEVPIAMLVPNVGPLPVDYFDNKIRGVVVVDRRAAEALLKGAPKLYVPGVIATSAAMENAPAVFAAAPVTAGMASPIEETAITDGSTTVNLASSEASATGVETNNAPNLLFKKDPRALELMSSSSSSSSSSQPSVAQQLQKGDLVIVCAAPPDASELHLTAPPDEGNAARVYDAPRSDWGNDHHGNGDVRTVGEERLIEKKNVGATGLVVQKKKKPGRGSRGGSGTSEVHSEAEEEGEEKEEEEGTEEREGKRRLRDGQYLDPDNDGSGMSKHPRCQGEEVTESDCDSREIQNPSSDGSRIGRNHQGSFVPPVSSSSSAPSSTTAFRVVSSFSKAAKFTRGEVIPNDVIRSIGFADPRSRSGSPASAELYEGGGEAGEGRSCGAEEGGKQRAVSEEDCFGKAAPSSPGSRFALLRVGVGRMAMDRADIFRNRKGVAVEMTHPVYRSHPLLDDLMSTVAIETPALNDHPSSSSFSEAASTKKSDSSATRSESLGASPRVRAPGQSSASTSSSPSLERVPSPGAPWLKGRLMVQSLPCIVAGMALMASEPGSGTFSQQLSCCSTGSHQDLDSLPQLPVDVLPGGPVRSSTDIPSSSDYYNDHHNASESESFDVSTNSPSCSSASRLHVLDMCAAPGGKTTLLAQLMNNGLGSSTSPNDCTTHDGEEFETTKKKGGSIENLAKRVVVGHVVAFDRSHAKVAEIDALCEELGVTCVSAFKKDAALSLTRRAFREILQGRRHRCCAATMATSLDGELEAEEEGQRGAVNVMEKALLSSPESSASRSQKRIRPSAPGDSPAPFDSAPSSSSASIVAPSAQPPTVTTISAKVLAREERRRKAMIARGITPPPPLTAAAAGPGALSATHAAVIARLARLPVPFTFPPGVVLSSSRSSANPGSCALPSSSPPALSALSVDSLSTLAAAGPCFAPEVFDRILLDAPCSGLGLRPRLVQPATPEFLRRCVLAQRRLIDTAVRLLRPGGALVYSTCTINPGENEGNVRYLLDKYGKYVRLVPAVPRVGRPGLVGSVGSAQLPLPSDPESTERVGSPFVSDFADDCAWLTREEALCVQRFDPSAEIDCMGFFLAKFEKVSSIPEEAV